MTTARRSIVRRVLDSAPRPMLLVLMAVATLPLLISTASAQVPWCGGVTRDFACKLNGAATVGPAGADAQLRRGQATVLEPGSRLTVFARGRTRTTFRTQAKCQFGHDRGTTSIRSRFGDALLLFDKGEGSCQFPKRSIGRVGLACIHGCPVLLEQDGETIIRSSGPNRLRQAQAEPTTVTYEQHITIDLCPGTATLYVLQPDGTFRPTVFRVRRGERTRVQIDAESTTTTSGSSTTSPTGSATSFAQGGSLTITEQTFNTPGRCSKLPF